MTGSMYNACDAGAADIYVIVKSHTYPFDTYFTHTHWQPTTTTSKFLGVAIYSHGRVWQVIFTIFTRKRLFWVQTSAFTIFTGWCCTKCASIHDHRCIISELTIPRNDGKL